MIVRYETDGTIVMITQNDHAQLSGLFAAHWGNELFEKPRPYGSMVRAAMFHDRGWIRYETGPQLDPETGKTPNYRASAERQDAARSVRMGRRLAAAASTLTPD